MEVVHLRSFPLKKDLKSQSTVSRSPRIGSTRSSNSSKCLRIRSAALFQVEEPLYRETQLKKGSNGTPCSMSQKTNWTNFVCKMFLSQRSIDMPMVLPKVERKLLSRKQQYSHYRQKQER